MYLNATYGNLLNETMMNQTMMLGDGLAVGKTRNENYFGDDFKSVNKIHNQFKITELYTNALVVKMISKDVIEIE